MYTLTGNFRFTPVRHWFTQRTVLQVEVQRYVTQGFTGHSIPEFQDYGEPYFKDADEGDAINLKAILEGLVQDRYVVQKAKYAEIRLAELATQYEELRKLIDGGSESMTHEDAVQELELMTANSRVIWPGANK